MNTRTRLIMAGAFWAGATLPGPSPAAAQERFSLTSDRVAVYNLAGEVRIEAGTGPNVVVEVTRGGDDGDRLAIERSERDGWQTLVVTSPERSIVYRGMGRFSRTQLDVHSDGTFGTRNLDPSLGSERVAANVGARGGNRSVRVAGSGGGLEAHADLRIFVPIDHAVAVHLGAGRINVSNVAGDLQLDTRSGSISARHTTGFLRIDTGSGSIEVDRAQGDVALQTGSGSVEANDIGNGVVMIATGSGSVDLSGVSASELKVVTGSGSIRATTVTAKAMRLATGSGSIRTRAISASKFDLHTGSGSIALDLDIDVDMGRVRTGSGSVTITTSRAFGAEIKLDTGSGGIHVDVPVDVIERRKSFLHARIGDGRGTLDVGTGSGRISLR